jgi:hypothetical protein
MLKIARLKRTKHGCKELHLQPLAKLVHGKVHVNKKLGCG